MSNSKMSGLTFVNGKLQTKLGFQDSTSETHLNARYYRFVCIQNKKFFGITFAILTGQMGLH